MSDIQDSPYTLSFSQLGQKWNSAFDAQDVVNKIRDYQILKVLKLDGNTLGVEAAEAIGNALSEHPEFERALWNDLFTGRLKAEIPTALSHLFNGLIRANAKLIELNLSDNALGPVGVTGMMEFMKSPVCYSLQELKLNNNGLGSTGGSMLAKALLELKDNSEEAGRPLQLKVFIVGRNKLENNGAASFSKFFSAVGTLEVIQMPQNSIFHEGVATLAKAFGKNRNLKTINLNDNTFTIRGAKSMAEYLPDIKNVESINFGDCLLRNDGAKKLAEALSVGHEKLQYLHLDGNEIKLTGALALADAIANKPNFLHLGLQDNQIGVELPDELSEKMNKMGKLQTLDYDENLDSDPDESWESDTNADSNEDSEDDATHDYEIVEPKECERNDAKYGTSAKEFLQQPTLSAFLSLGMSASTDLIAALRMSAVDTAERLEIMYEESLVSELLGGVMKLSSIPCTQKSQIQVVAECSKILWEEAFSMINKLGVQYLSNSLLIQLGALKSEDKKFKIEWDIRKCLQEMSWLLNMPCVPIEVRLCLKAVLTIPESKLSSYREEVHQLIGKLF